SYVGRDEGAFDDPAVAAEWTERTVSGGRARFGTQVVNVEVEPHRAAGIAQLEAGMVTLNQVLENVTFLPADGVRTVAVVVRGRKLGELDVQVARDGVDGVRECARRARCRIPEIMIGV